MKKILNRETVMYLIFGVLTTAVNYLSYYAFTRWAGIDKNIANTLSIVVSIVFAFWTNKRFVFGQGSEQGQKSVGKMFMTFVGFRLLAMGFDIGLFYALSTLMSIHDLVAKIVVSGVVIVFNYFVSKLFVFNNTGGDIHG